MKKLKKIMLVIVIAMPFSRCIAVESFDCDGTGVLNCHPAYTSPNNTWISGGVVYNNVSVAYGSGSNNINMCTGASDDNANCSQNGTVPCSYSVTITDSTGDVIFTGSNSSPAATYQCS